MDDFKNIKSRNFTAESALELTPNEFKSLYIPYYENVSDSQFNNLEKMLRAGEPINKILDYTDNIILRKVLSLGEPEISRLRLIYETLVARRKKDKTATY